jgi:hypothetical protein
MDAKTLHLLSFLLFLCSCTSSNSDIAQDNCTMSINEFIDNINKVQFCERYKYIGISSEDRKGNYICLNVYNDSTHTTLWFYNYHKPSPMFLRRTTDWYNVDIVRKYSPALTSEKALRAFTHQLITEARQNCILQYSYTDWGVKIITSLQDSSYNELRSNHPDYYDYQYEQTSKHVISCGCPLNYRYEVLIFNRSDSHALAIFQQNKKYYRYNDSIYVGRSIGRYDYATLSEKPACYCPF